MTEAATLQSLQPVAPAQPLVCRLRRKQVIHRGKPIPNMGEVELESLSPSAVEIAYWMTPLQYLNLSGDRIRKARWYLRDTSAIVSLRLWSRRCFVLNPAKSLPRMSTFLRPCHIRPFRPETM